MNISIERLSGSASAFQNLTFPRYRSLVQTGDEGVVLIAATSGFKPVGLALAECNDHREEARLLSLAVDAAERNQGVGRALLRTCERAVTEAGCKTVVTYHSSRLPSAAAFQATLLRCGWEEPRVLNVRSAGRCGALAAAIAEWPGVRRMLRNTAFSFEPWSTVTAADDAAIDRLSSEPTCVPNMSPKSWVGLLDPRVSIAIRHRGTMVGWVLLRLDAEGNQPMFHCDSAYIQHDLWRTGVLVAGYLHSYRAVEKDFGPDCVVRFLTGSRMPGMLALVRRRFASVSLWVDDWMVSRKVLSGRA